MKYYTYIIKSTVNGAYFYGQTSNLLKRLNQHNHGLEEKTRDGRPWILLAFKEFDTRNGAMSFERKLQALNSPTEVENFISENGFQKV